jgi:hypothetical protein
VSLERVSLVARDLAFLSPAPLFFGAAILELYLDAGRRLDWTLRPTDDVDVVVSVVAAASEFGAIASMEQVLHDRGFRPDPRPHRKNIDA